MRMLPLLWAALALVQTPQARTSTTPDDPALRQLETDWNTAHTRGDAASLDRLLADDVIIQVPGMRVLNKADALAMFTTGRMTFDQYETTETTFRVYGDTAIATGRLRRTRTAGGAVTDDDWRFTKVYLRRAGRWQVVSFHASNTAA